MYGYPTRLYQPLPLQSPYCSLDEPEAKSSMIWIIGEYAERIDNADELMAAFLETFPEESSMVGTWRGGGGGD